MCHRTNGKLQIVKIANCTCLPQFKKKKQATRATQLKGQPKNLLTERTKKKSPWTETKAGRTVLPLIHNGPTTTITSPGFNSIIWLYLQKLGNS